MKTALGLVLAIVALLATTATADSDSLKTISASNLNFTNSIYKILAKQDGNVFFSPLSIDVILALAYMGARGSTAQQMAAGLHLPADENVVKEGFKAMMQSLKSDENITLSIANKLFAEQTFTLKPEFVAIARNSFLADVDTVDFKRNAEAARLHINKWVENKTNDKIRDIISPGSIDSLTSLILVNALHFKASWSAKFHARETIKKAFFLTANKTTIVDMMFQKHNFGFIISSELDCKVLEMPYLGKKLSMVIFLPNAVDGLAQLEAKLAEVDLPKLMTGLRKRPKVRVLLPKFKMEQTTNLTPVLKELGMVNMFDEFNADFSGITDGPLYASSVVHMAVIDVSEGGSEAAAATRMKFSSRISDNAKNFFADHPFVFHIRDNHSGAVLFMGRLSSV